MVALVHGGFPEILSKVTSFKSYFRQKTTKKDFSEGRKNVTFCENCCSGRGGFS